MIPNKTDHRTLQELETVEAMLSCNEWKHLEILKDRRDLMRYAIKGQGESLEDAAYAVWVKHGWTEDKPF